MAAVTVGMNHSGVVITSDGAHAYVTNLASNSVSVIDTATNTVTATITSLSSPNGIALTPNDEYAYITNGGNNSVSIISTTMNTVNATVTVGINPYGVAITPNSEYAYVTNLISGTVSVINTATNLVLTDSSPTSDQEFPAQLLIIAVVGFAIVVFSVIAITKKKSGKSNSTSTERMLFLNDKITSSF
jgi:YVTN family beta-propeller protein